MDSCQHGGILWYLWGLTVEARIPAEVHKETRRQMLPVPREPKPPVRLGVHHIPCYLQSYTPTEAPSLPGGSSHSVLPAEIHPNRSPQLAWGFITFRATLLSEEAMLLALLFL